MDYRDHKPHLNAPLVRLLVSGVGLRQSGRSLSLSLRCTELKARKIARHLRHLNINLRGCFPREADLHLVEIRTHESRLPTRPVLISLAVEGSSRFHIWAETATLPPHSTARARHARSIADDERRFGPRRNRSRAALEATLNRARPLFRKHRRLLARAGGHRAHKALLKKVFGTRLVACEGDEASRIRTAQRPGFAAALARTMARDNLGRLRPRSWLVSRQRVFLDLAFHMYMAWRNYVRPRFNGERCTSAQVAGFTSRPLSIEETLSWRQDWGPRATPVPWAKVHWGRKLPA